MWCDIFFRVSLLVVIGGLFLNGCALFPMGEDAEVVEIIATQPAQEERAIQALFEQYATAMTTKDAKLFEGVFSEKFSSTYRSEIESFAYITTQCDMEMTVQSVKPYYLSDTEATVEVVFDTRYTYVPESKKDTLKDFRLTTRFHLLKIEDRWIIEYNIKKYIQKTLLDDVLTTPVS